MRRSQIAAASRVIKAANMSKKWRAADISQGVFSTGEKVEVLSEEEGFSSAWAVGTIISSSQRVSLARGIFQVC